MHPEDVRRHREPIRKPANWGRRALAVAEPPQRAPDPEEYIPEPLAAVAEEFGLTVDDLWWHVEAGHGWEPHDIGYEVAGAAAAACASRSVRAGGSARDCLAANEQ